MRNVVVGRIVDGVMAATLVAGLIFGIQGAMNIGLFIVWLLFLVSFLSRFPGVADAAAGHKDYPGVYRVAEICFDVAIVLLLIWHGRWFSGTAYAMHMAMLYLFYSVVRKIRTEKAEESKSASVA
jgi:hypothetical protein